jgi:hypothetical protein
MQHTLIAVFDNHNDAVSAKDELLSSGFTSSDVRLSHGDETATRRLDVQLQRRRPRPRRPQRHEPGIGASIKNFFSDIFGSDNDEHSTKYSDRRRAAATTC